MARLEARPRKSCSPISTANQPDTGYSNGNVAVAPATHSRTRRVPSSSITIPPWMESAVGSTERAATTRPISAAFSPTASAWSGTTTVSMSHTPLLKNPAPSEARRSRRRRPAARSCPLAALMISRGAVASERNVRGRRARVAVPQRRPRRQAAIR